MPRVHFLNEVVTIDVPKGKTLYEVAAQAKVSLFKGFWKSYHCGGKGRCLGAGCKVWITELQPNAVSPKTSWKEKVRSLSGTQRLACMVQVNGDVEVRTQPGTLEFSEDPTWEPDPRHFRWQDRLVEEKKKKKKPAKKKDAAAPVADDADDADDAAEAAAEEA